MSQTPPSFGSRARRRVARALPGVGRLAELSTAVASQGRRIEGLTARVNSQKERLDRQRARLDAFAERFVPFERASNLRAVEHARQGHQLGAVEQRLGALEQRLADGHLTSDTESEAQARSLIDEIRREHEQIRVRMQIVSAYEERLRRVEESVAELYDGDPRHPV